MFLKELLKTQQSSHTRITNSIKQTFLIKKHHHMKSI